MPILSRPDPDAPTQPDAAAPPRRRRLLRFFFSSALGCTAFAFGALVVLVLLLPTLLSGWAAGALAGGFDRACRGRLEVESVALAWFGDQQVRGLVLRDPEGAEVARASATLPSLWRLLTSGGARFGTIAAEVEADLVADDAGRTNLQRALERRAPPADEPAGTSTVEASTTFDLSEFLDALEVELRVDARRLAWSDAQTRRLGAPFEVKDVALVVSAKPGRPARLTLKGDVANAGQGALEADVSVFGPIDPGARWPLGRTEAKVRVERFSTAMVDGVAGLSGDLVELLGPTFALRVELSAQSAESASVHASLDGARGGVGLAVRLQDGELLALDEPFLVASVPFPRHVLERVLRPHLPPDAEVDLSDAAGAPWTVRIPRLRMPLPDPAARDLAALRPVLEKAELAVDVDLPGRIAASTQAMRDAGVGAALSGLRLTARATPGAPLVAQARAALDAGAPGSVRVDLTVPGAFAALAEGRVPPVDADLVVEGLSLGAAGELAGQGQRFARALGPVLGVRVVARGASLDGGTARVELTSERLAATLPLAVADGRLRLAETPARLAWTPDEAALAAELAPFLPEGARVTVGAGAFGLEITELDAPLRDAAGAFAGADALLAGSAARARITLPDVGWSDLRTQAAQLAPFVRGFALDVSLPAGAPPSASGAATLDLGRPARLELAASARAPLADLAQGGVPACDARVDLKGLDAAAVGRLVGQADLLAETVGGTLDLAARFEGAWPDAARVSLDLRGGAGRGLTFAGRVEGGRLVASGDEGLDLRVAVSTELVRARLGDALPPDARVEVPGGTGALVVSARDLDVPLDGRELPALLAALAARLEVALPPIIYADARTAAAGRNVQIQDASLKARCAPGELAEARLAARVVDTPPGDVDVTVQALDPLAKLLEEGGLDAFRARVRVQAASLPTGLVDALAAQDGLLVEALGPTATLDVDAPELSLARGAFTASFQSALHQVRCKGRIAERTLHVDEVDGLLARLALGPLVSQRIVGALVPLLVDVRKPEGAEPLKLSVDSLSCPLDGDLSKLDADVRLDLGQVTYRLLPGLEALGGLGEMKAVTLPAIAIPIRQGVARYERLPLQVGGREVAFRGSVRLVDGEFDLGADVPLDVLGKKVNAELDKVRQFLPADTLVPIEVRGTWRKPRFAIGKDFLKSALEKAAEKGMGGLLDELLGGKKKPKDGR